MCLTFCTLSRVSDRHASVIRLVTDHSVPLLWNVIHETLLLLIDPRRIVERYYQFLIFVG